MRRALLAALAVAIAAPAAGQISYRGPLDRKALHIGPRAPGIEYTQQRFDWYVDSVTGSDADDGRSEVSAFATLGKLQTMAIAHGARIGLAKGSTWREKLTVTASSLLVATYGSGAAPIIDGADIVPAVSWAKTDGRTNVYETSLAVQVSALATEWPSIWVDGARLVRAADLAACDATSGTYYHAAAEGATPITVYVNSGSDATADGKLYEAAIRTAGLDAWGATGASVYGIHATRPYASYGGIVVGPDSLLADSRSSQGNLHNIFLRGGSTARDCLADGVYAYGVEPTPYVWYETNGAGKSITFIRCSATSTYAMQGFYGHTPGTAFGTITYDACTVSGPATSKGFGGANATNVRVIGGTVTADTCVSFSSDGSVSGLTCALVTAGQNSFVVGVAGKTVSVTGSTSTIPAGLNASTFFSSTVDSTVVTLTGNTQNASYASARGSARVVKLTGATSSLTASGNSWGTNSTAGWGYDLGANTAVVSDYNTWRRDAQFVVGSTTHATLAAFTAATSQDAHSTIAP